MTTIKLKAQELKRYSLFSKQDEMDRDIWAYVEWLQEYNVRQSVVDVLLHLGSRALMYLGIAFPKQTTIAKCLKLSDKTVNLAIKDLETLGIIESRRTLNGWQASGKVYRIKPFCREQLDNKVKSEGKVSKIIKLNSINELTLVSDFEPYSINQKSLKKDVASKKESSNVSPTHKTFYQTLKTLAQARKGSISNFSRLMKIIFGKLKKLKNEAVQLSQQQLENLMYQSFDALLLKKNVKNDEAMLNAIITNKLNDLIVPATTTQDASLSNVQAPLSKVEREPDWLEQHRVEQEQREEARKREHELRMKELEKEGLEAAAERVKRKLLGLE